MTELAFTPYFTYWRSVELGSRVVLEGLVAPEHALPSPALARDLARWDGAHYWQRSSDGRWLVLVREDAPQRERWWLHALLLAVTLVTTTLGGAALAGADVRWWLPTIAQLRAGLPFSIPLLAILFAHESGHYVTARRYRVNASPPYFIPFPASWNIIGTLGAFIRLRSPLFDRRTLFDVGAGGPFAGALVAIPVVLIGLARSVPDSTGPALTAAHQYITVAGGPALLGDSLVLVLARMALGLGTAVPLRLDLVAVAGWVGLFITSLNLLPLAQFDGGHIAYALFGRRQLWVARVLWVALLPLGRLWPGWWVWAVLALLVGRGSLLHPPVIADDRPLDGRRRAAGWLAVALFLITFSPMPIV